MLSVSLKGIEVATSGSVQYWSRGQSNFERVILLEYHIIELFLRDHLEVLVCLLDNAANSIVINRLYTTRVKINATRWSCWNIYVWLGAS